MKHLFTEKYGIDDAFILYSIKLIKINIKLDENNESDEIFGKISKQQDFNYIFNYRNNNFHFNKSTSI